MFQKEVADRITAAPGGKAYGRLSVLAQWRAQATRLFDIDRRAFTPPPKVTSSVVQIVPATAVVEPIAERADLERVTAAGLRPAAQDAADEPQAAGTGRRRGNLPGARGHRSEPAGRTAVGRRFLPARRSSQDDGECNMIQSQALVAYGAPLTETRSSLPTPQGRRGPAAG